MKYTDIPESELSPIPEETQREEKYKVSATFDYEGYPDYYRGHGHAFEDPSLVACLRFGVLLNFGETIKEVIDEVMEDVRSIAFELLSEDSNEEKEVEQFLTDDRIRKALEAEITEGVDFSERFFEGEILPDGEEEYPMLIGYIHVWRR